nr:ribosomal protein L14 [Ipomoea batatas]
MMCLLQQWQQRRPFIMSLAPSILLEATRIKEIASRCNFTGPKATRMWKCHYCFGPGNSIQSQAICPDENGKAKEEEAGQADGGAGNPEGKEECPTSLSPSCLFSLRVSLYLKRGASNRRYAHIGDIIVAVIKEAVPNMPLERSEVVIVRTCKELKRDNGMIIRYDENAAVVIDQEGNPKGTRILGANARELRQ